MKQQQNKTKTTKQQPLLILSYFIVLQSYILI